MDFFINDNNKSIIHDIINSTILNNCPNIELVEINYSTMYNKLNLTVYIWKKEGISLNDCELVHNYVSSTLDNYENLFPEDYILNVSSLGLDRKIESNDDYRRSLGTDIEIFISKKEKNHGILLNYNDDEIIIKSDKNEIKYNRNNLLKVQPFIKF